MLNPLLNQTGMKFSLEEDFSLNTRIKVIGVGGGSALDIAKQAAVVSAGDGGVEPYLLCATPWLGRRPIARLPSPQCSTSADRGKT